MGGVVGYSRHNRDRGNTSGCCYRARLCSNVSDKVSNKRLTGGYLEFTRHNCEAYRQQS